MSKMSKISGQATSLGIASVLALASWSTVAHTQETAAADKPAAPVQTKAGPAVPPGAKAKGEGKDKEKAKDALPPGLQHAKDKDLPVHAADAAQGGPGGPRGPGAPSTGPVSRADAMKHYRTAHQQLTAIPEPADPKSEAAAEARKDRRDALRDLRRARDEILRSHNEARREFQKRDPDEVEKLRKKVTQHTADLRKDRKDRADKSRKEAEKVVGDKPLHPAVKEELRSHAWRVARLNQLVYLAELDNKPKQAEKAKELLSKENASHADRLKALLAKAEVKNYKPPAPAPETKDKPGTAAKLPPGHPPMPNAASKPAAQPAGEAK